MDTAPSTQIERPTAPCFNVLIMSQHGPCALRQALRSVKEQTFRDYEVIVVDSSSEDVAQAVAAVEPRAKVIQVDCAQGAAAARNAALGRASGQYTAFLDTADTWHPGYLQYHYAAHQAMPEALFTFADYFLHGPHRSGPVRQLTPEPLAENALLHMVMRPFVHTMSCFVARNADIIAARGFDAERGRYAEIDLCVRLLAGRPGRKGLACLARPALSVPQVLAVKRLTDDVGALNDEVAEWEAQRDGFIESLFARAFMAPFADRKLVCKSSLARSQRTHFTSYFSDRVMAAMDDDESAAPRIEPLVKAASSAKPARPARLTAGPSTRIAMIHHGRCGSQVLGDLLNQHSQICWEGEIFEPLIHKLPKRPMSHLRRRVHACGNAMYGFETKLHHPGLIGSDWPEYVKALEQLGFRKFIVQRRRNLLRAFISGLVAKAKGHVYHVPVGTPASLKKLTIDPKAVYFFDEPADLLETMRFTTRRLEFVQQLLKGHEVVHLTYEDDIAEEPTRGYRKVCEFLSVEEEPVTVSLGRTTPFPLSEIIENFDEVRAALAGTEFQWMIAE